MIHILSDSMSIFIAVFVTLFPIVNPLGGAPIFLSYVQNCSLPVRSKIALGVSISSFFLLLGAMIIGPQLLLFFGISLPALKVAGGLVVTSMGWNLLNQSASSNKSDSNEAKIDDSSISAYTFFPLTMPLTAGPGSIATAISIVAAYKTTSNIEFDLSHIVGVLLGLLALSITIFIAYREASATQRILGTSGTLVLMRLFAFILLAIGIQILWGGINGFAMEIAKELPLH